MTASVNANFYHALTTLHKRKINVARNYFSWSKPGGLSETACSIKSGCGIWERESAKTIPFDKNDTKHAFYTLQKLTTPTESVIQKKSMIVMHLTTN